MTTPQTDSLESNAADRAQTFIDWTKINSKALTIGAAVVVIAAGGFWFYNRLQQTQAAAAERALMQAKQSMSAGNLQLAQSDLQKVYSQYGKTGAGIEAAMLLAQIDYDQAKFQDGITRLDKIGASGENAATILSLKGDGLAQMGKPADAAKAYQDAANASGFENEKAFQQAKAARAFQAAGDTTKARELWTSLLNDPKAQTTAAEARVRLGELTAKTAGK
jgi:predicted negative regulator of RcsB-dependent stress response